MDALYLWTTSTKRQHGKIHVCSRGPRKRLQLRALSNGLKALGSGPEALGSGLEAQEALGSGLGSGPEARGSGLEALETLGNGLEALGSGSRSRRSKRSKRRAGAHPQALRNECRPHIPHMGAVGRGVILGVLRHQGGCLRSSTRRVPPVHPSDSRQFRSMRRMGKAMRQWAPARLHHSAPPPPSPLALLLCVVVHMPKAVPHLWAPLQRTLQQGRHSQPMILRYKGKVRDGVRHSRRSTIMTKSAN
jgi:hypothetical protein|mmetsp:Transcript_80531/g.134742  ORF Transcript_80531/g.134742 Transcript_80531/m.134742 type:complete len:247 (-) Transcript_80531:304-1044(-)